MLRFVLLLQDFKANNVDPILNSVSRKGIYANVSVRTVRNLIRGNVEQCRIMCNYSFITSSACRLQKTNRVRRSHRISSPLPGHHMCTSERQSYMTAIYSHWVRWKVLALSLRPRSPKRMGKETDKAGKRPVNFDILGCLGCFPMAGTRTCMQLYRCVWAWNTHTHTHTLLLILRCGPLMFKVLYLLCMSVLSNHFQHWE